MTQFRRVFATAALCALVAGCTGHASLPAASTDAVSMQVRGLGDQTTLTYIDLPAPYGFPWSFVNAPDGSLYFGEWAENGNPGGIGRLNADGSITEFELGPSANTPILGAFDASQDLWFSNCGGYLCAGYDTFDFLSAQGGVSQIPAPTGSRPRFTAVDPNGNVWYVLARADAVERISPSGSVTQFPLPREAFNRANANDIVVGPDGALWITEVLGNAIVRMSFDGTVTNVFAIPDQEAGPRFIAAGTDGNLWISELGSLNFSGDSYTPPQIVKMTTSGAMTAYPLPSASCAPDSLRAANNGFVFADLGCNAVGLIDYTGNVVELPIQWSGGTNGDVQFAIQGSDGSYYFADDDANRLGKITLGKKGMIFPNTFSLAAGSTQLVGVGVLGDRGPYTATVDNANVATVAPISGFPMNFTVTAVAPGTATLTIKGKGKAMTASITVTSSATSNASRRRTGVANLH